MNCVSMLGRICYPLELKQGGKTCYCRFVLAIPRDGKKEEADFVPCIAFGKNAEFLVQYFQKGSRIALLGKMRVEEYDDKDGSRKKNISVVATSLFFCESKMRQDLKPTRDPLDDDADLETDMVVPF